LDFDGTLVPIRKDPACCILSEETKELLQFLANSRYCYLAIISGRSLSDIKGRVGLRRVFYGGNHGLDIRGPKLRYTHPKALTTKRVIDQVKLRLMDEIKGFEGAWLEDKKFTLSLHFRSARKEQIAALKDVFLRTAREFLHQSALSILRGKKVLELMPTVSWDKGRAARWILRDLKNESLPVYVGDDHTDEAAFEVLRETGITVRVGKSERTSAEYYLKGQWEVAQLLRSFKDLCSHRQNSGLTNGIVYL